MSKAVLKFFNLEEKFKQITEFWNPHIVGNLNGQEIKIAKIKGEFVWHSHDHADEFFYVFKGSFRMELTDQILTLKEGDGIIIPMGVEHRPVAEEECQIILFEPKGTVNTGTASGPLTRINPPIL